MAKQTFSEVLADLKSELNSALRLDHAEEIKSSVLTAINHAEKLVLNLHYRAEGAIDPLVLKWAASKYTMPIAVGFGVMLLSIGYFFGKVF